MNPFLVQRARIEKMQHPDKVPEAKLEEAIAERRELLPELVGWMLRSIVTGQIERLESRLQARRTHRR